MRAAVMRGPRRCDRTPCSCVYRRKCPGSTSGYWSNPNRGAEQRCRMTQGESGVCRRVVRVYTGLQSGSAGQETEPTSSSTRYIREGPAFEGLSRVTRGRKGRRDRRPASQCAHSGSLATLEEGPDGLVLEAVADLERGGQDRHRLVDRLRILGHPVEVVREVGLGGRSRAIGVSEKASVVSQQSWWERPEPGDGGWRAWGYERWEGGDGGGVAGVDAPSS